MLKSFCLSYYCWTHFKIISSNYQKIVFCPEKLYNYLKWHKNCKKKIASIIKLELTLNIMVSKKYS